MSDRPASFTSIVNAIAEGVPKQVGAASCLVLAALALFGFPAPRRVIGQPEKPRDSATARRDAADETAAADSAPVDILRLPCELDVVVVGGCAAGLATGASLAHCGVRNYVVFEGRARSGDQWRGRYDRLHLHDVVDMCHLPLFPVPTSFPRYPSRLQFANYLDAYQLALSVKVAYNTTVTNITKRADGKWDVSAKSANGAMRTVCAKHVVMAAGVYNKPVIPSFPGRDSFQGVVMHSSEYSGAAAMGLAGKRVLVVGFGNSGAEIAVDLYEGDVAQPVHVVVRSPIRLVTRSTIEALQLNAIRFIHPVYALVPLLLPLVPVLAIAADLATIAASWISFGSITKFNLSRLRSGTLSGVALYFEPPVMDVGTMALVRRGAVVCHKAPIQSFRPTGVELVDGTLLDVDVVVLATGFEMLAEHGRLVTNGEQLIGTGKAATRSGKIRGGQECRGEASGMWFVFGNLFLIKHQSAAAATSIAKRLGVYKGSTAAKTSRLGIAIALVAIGGLINAGILGKLLCLGKVKK